MSDIDPTETGEWLQALESVLHFEAPSAQYLLEQLSAHASDVGLATGAVTTPNVNTLPASAQAAPG